jgi:hypothetical protein
MNSAYNHIQSAHCENGVTVGLLKNQGIEFITEPLAFGIGSGLFYIHIPYLKVNNGPAIAFRTFPGAIFKRTCKALDIKIKSINFKKEEEAKKFLDNKINENIPVGCQVGVFHLTYFPKEYRFHFNAHNLIVLNKQNDEYLISDPVMETTSTIKEYDLMRARFAKGPLAPKGKIYFPIEKKAVNKELLQKAIIKGIKRNVRDMLHIPGNIAGVKGIKFTSKKIRSWRNKLGTKQAGLYLGQIIRMQEEIGTGGGGFRYIYAAFLQQSSEILNNTELKAISEMFTQSGDLWRLAATKMASVFKGRNNSQKDFDEISEIYLQIYQLEKSAFTSLKKLNLK